MFRVKKPIVFFDLETTGVSPELDRIVEIACIKIDTEDIRTEIKTLIHPTIEIPKEASEVHGIYLKDLDDAPTFRKISEKFNNFFKGCDIGGYNSNSFDVPFLVKEFERCGIDFKLEGRDFIDVFKIEQQANPRTLEAVYERYTGEKLEGAHDALNDVRATVEILERQIDNHKLPKSIKKIDTYSQGDRKRVDLAGKFTDIEGEICWAFGKNRGQYILKDSSYANWFMGADFPLESKDILRKLALQRKIYLKTV